MLIKNRLIILVLIIFKIGKINCQNDRLFGDCENEVGSYICNQILIKENSEFEFYDYLHLRGGTRN